VVARRKPGHSSEPGKGVNAIGAAADAIAWLNGEARRFAAQGPFDAKFDLPHTTVHVGTIEGGTILNIIPERCAFVIEWRTIPSGDFFAEVERLRAHLAAVVEPAMKAVDPACGFALEVMNRIPGMVLPGGHGLADMVKQLTGSNSTGYVTYGTEGELYEQAGIPTIICGLGSIAQAHQPDEWIEQAQLDACDAFIRRLADRLTG